MTFREMKHALALLLVLAIGLAFEAGPTAAAPGAGLNWEVNGTGSGTVESSSGTVLAQFVGNGTYELSISRGTPLSEDSSCSIARGSGNFTSANDRSSVDFLTVGLLCRDSAGGVDHYNATFRITSGSGRFATAGGDGTLAVTYGETNFLKADATITF
jgi:hypothetical protein